MQSCQGRVLLKPPDGRLLDLIETGKAHPVTARKDDAEAANQAGTGSASKLRQATHPPLRSQHHPAPQRQRIARFNLGHQQGRRVDVSRRPKKFSPFSSEVDFLLCPIGIEYLPA